MGIHGLLVFYFFRKKTEYLRLSTVISFVLNTYQVLETVHFTTIYNKSFISNAPRQLIPRSAPGNKRFMELIFAYENLC